MSWVHFYFTNSSCHFSKCAHNTVVWKLKKSFCIGNKNRHAGGGHFGTIILLLSHAFYTRPVLAFGYCCCLRVCMCVCVHVSVNHEFVCPITHQLLKLESQNLDQICKRPWLRSILFCGAIDHDLQGQIELQFKICPILSLWACPFDKSPPIEVSISKFGPEKAS